MPARTRIHSEVSPYTGKGQRNIFGTVVDYYRYPINGVKNTCSDVTDGTRNPHGLFIEKSSLNCETLNGNIPTPNNTKSYSDLRPTWAASPHAEGAPETLPALPSANLMATDVINRSNPSRASVDLGVTIAELRDAPQLLLRATGGLIRGGANAFLSYKFGWEPLTRDIVDCFKVVDHVAMRQKELTRLASNGGLRRRINFPTEQGKRPPRVVVLESELGDVFYGSLVQASERKSWGTARWVPSPPSPFTQGSIPMRARRAVYGGHFDASTAWNLIPWSWMIDWFGNFGDFLETGRNTVGAELEGSVCIMSTTVHRDTYTRISGPELVTGGGGSNVTILKTRSIVPFVMPEFQMPFIGAGRLSILGALGVSRIPLGALPTTADAMDIIRSASQRIRR